MTLYIESERGTIPSRTLRRQRLTLSPPTYICDFGADLCESVPRTLVRGVEEVRAQQRLQGAADGNQEQLGMVVTHTGYRAGGELAKRRLHGNNARGEDLSDRETPGKSQSEGRIRISSLFSSLFLLHE